MSDLVVLMYHALYASDAELQSIDAEDRPYAVSTGDFAAHLEAIRASSAEVIGYDPSQLGAGRTGRARVLITFDDGHRSNHDHALPLLLRFDMRALFFVTSDFIGRRPGFCSWAQLRAVREAGMAVESHGATHRFLDAMSAEQAYEEFERSKRIIEAEVGHEVTAVSFPGGRFSSTSLAAGRTAGIRHFFCSRPGVNAQERIRAGSLPLRRFAVRRQTGADIIADIARRRTLTVGRIIAKSAAKEALRRALGNRLYHWAYRRGAA
jgi:peptidoglycan/xylan/chitin deacetylase (PgdA/CDA1 family)